MLNLYCSQCHDASVKALLSRAEVLSTLRHSLILILRRDIVCVLGRSLAFLLQNAQLEAVKVLQLQAESVSPSSSRACSFVPKMQPADGARQP